MTEESVIYIFFFKKKMRSKEYLSVYPPHTLGHITVVKQMKSTLCIMLQELSQRLLAKMFSSLFCGVFRETGEILVRASAGRTTLL